MASTCFGSPLPKLKLGGVIGVRGGAMPATVKESPTLVDGDGGGLSRLDTTDSTKSNGLSESTRGTQSTRRTSRSTTPEVSMLKSISSISLPKSIRMMPKKTDWSTRRWRPRANATELTELLSEGDDSIELRGLVRSLAQLLAEREQMGYAPGWQQDEPLLAMRDAER